MVNPCIRRVPARSSGCLRELANFTIRIFGKMCQLACSCLVSSTFPRTLEDRLTLLGRLCVSEGGRGEEGHQRSLLRKVEATLEPYATGLPVPGHLGNAIVRPLPGLGRRNECVFASGLLVLGHLCFAMGRPKPLKGHRILQRIFGTWFSDLHLFFPSFLTDGDSPFSMHKSFSSHNQPKDSTAGDSSKRTIVPK